MTEAGQNKKDLLKEPILEHPGADFNRIMKKMIIGAINKTDANFVCDGYELTNEEVYADDGMQPLIVWKAAHNLEKIWGKQDLVFRCEADALCGVLIEQKKEILPVSVWVYAVFDLIKNEIDKTNNKTINMDAWYAEWQAALKNKKVLLLPPAQKNTASA